MISGSMLMRLLTGMAMAPLLLAPSWVQAQGARPAKPAASTAFTEAVTRAKESGRPLVVFGVSEGCSRCAGLKQGLSTESELKLLLTQYVAAEVPFGGREFAAIFDGIVRQDPKYRQAIGAPSVFIFTAAGDVVYAGPNSPEGMKPGDEFKKLLIGGLEKNGGLRGGGKSSVAAGLAGDVAKARKLLSESQPIAAAAAISKYVSAENVTEDEAALTKLTGLKVARSKPEEQLDSLVQQLTEKGLALREAALASAKPGDAVASAVQLAELERVFGSFPALAGKFDAAWTELLAKAETPNLQEQAQSIDKARQSEAGSEPAQAIAAYEQVLATYPGTKAAEYCKLQITRLQAPKVAASRLWKSKSGKFSVSASLLSFDGKEAQLRTDAGKTITVPLDSLSAEDQQFLTEARPQN